jgi:lactate dehydrogenase-like 2-hydroxyacid dehydrogenase
LDSASYKNVVDALDEMQICSIGKYVIDKINEQDQKLLDKKGVK